MARITAQKSNQKIKKDLDRKLEKDFERKKSLVKKVYQDRESGKIKRNIAEVVKTQES